VRTGSEIAEPSGVLEIVSSQGDFSLVHQPLGRETPAADEYALAFTVTEAMARGSESVVEVRMWASGTMTASMSSVTIECLTGPAAAPTPCRPVVRRSTQPQAVEEWLPLLSIGEAGERFNGLVRTRPRQSGPIVFGPGQYLLPGRYRVRIRMAVEAGEAAGEGTLAVLEVVSASGSVCLARQTLSLEQPGKRDHTLFIVVTEAMAPGPESCVEVRVRTAGMVTATISSVSVWCTSGDALAENGSESQDDRASRRHPLSRTPVSDVRDIVVATSIPPEISRRDAGREVGRHYQTECVRSWIASGFRVLSLNQPEEIPELSDRHPGVRFIPISRDASWLSGRKNPLIADLLTALASQPEPIVGIINSDILLEAPERWRPIIGADIVNSVVMGHRCDIESRSSVVGPRFTRGFDYFFFERNAIGDILEGAPAFALGLPWWIIGCPWRWA
jgi:hypothetical protein